MADEISNASVDIFVALGSNIEPKMNLVKAVHLISQKFELRAASSVWESAPVGFLEQPAFLNAAIQIRSSLDFQYIRDSLREIETTLLRVRDPNNINAPRTIDLDIVLFGDQIVSTIDSQIPDPDILTRPFLAVPLAELDFDRVHPIQGITLGQIARNMGGITDLLLREDIRLKQCQPTNNLELQRRFN